MSRDPYWLNKLGEDYYFNQGDKEDFEALEDIENIEKEIAEEEELDK